MEHTHTHRLGRYRSERAAEAKHNQRSPARRNRSEPSRERGSTCPRLRSIWLQQLLVDTDFGANLPRCREPAKCSRYVTQQSEQHITPATTRRGDDFREPGTHCAWHRTVWMELSRTRFSPLPGAAAGLCRAAQTNAFSTERCHEAMSQVMRVSNLTGTFPARRKEKSPGARYIVSQASSGCRRGR